MEGGTKLDVNKINKNYSLFYHSLIKAHMTVKNPSNSRTVIVNNSNLIIIKKLRETYNLSLKPSRAFQCQIVKNLHLYFKFCE